MQNKINSTNNSKRSGLVAECVGVRERQWSRAESETHWLCAHPCVFQCPYIGGGFLWYVSLQLKQNDVYTPLCTKCVNTFRLCCLSLILIFQMRCGILRCLIKAESVIGSKTLEQPQICQILISQCKHPWLHSDKCVNTSSAFLNGSIHCLSLMKRA